MVNLHPNLRASVQFTARDLSSTSSSGTSSQSLADEISQAFSQTLKQLGIDPSSIKLTLDTGSGQTNGTSQNAVATSSNSGTSTTSNTSVTSNASAASQLGFNALVPRDNPTTTGQPLPATFYTSQISKHWYADNAADDAYWSKQPAAVRQLREIQDPQKRQALASQLAGEGYQIDNTIMVWGWDAGQVTAERQADGYTWVPSANQAAVTAAPGLSAPGMTPYDPNHPPAGSIAV